MTLRSAARLAQPARPPQGYSLSVRAERSVSEVEARAALTLRLCSATLRVNGPPSLALLSRRREWKRGEFPIDNITPPDG